MDHVDIEEFNFEDLEAGKYPPESLWIFEEGAINECPKCKHRQFRYIQDCTVYMTDRLCGQCHDLWVKGEIDL